LLLLHLSISSISWTIIANPLPLLTTVEDERRIQQSTDVDEQGGEYAAVGSLAVASGP